ncbi:MAG: acetyl-CoA carboxylase carboxyl transferase subunit beta, partial [Acidobacteriaceae bacterium]
MSWFRREDNTIESGAKRVRTEGLWTKCEGCDQTLWKADLDANLQVCPRCGRHGRIGARERIDSLLEPGYERIDGNLKSTDPLEFTDLKPYKGRLKKARADTGLNDAIVNAQG